VSTALVLGWPWNVKSGALYFGGYPAKAADAASFQPLSEFWGRDANHVFCATSVMRDADVKTFTVLNELYAKDARHAYTIKGQIKDADAASFTAVGSTQHPFDTTNGYAKDKNYVYHTVVGGKACVMKNADPETFAAYGRGWGGDKSSVYWERFRLQGAAPADWRPVGGPHSVSGKNAYCLKKKIRGGDGRHLESLPILDIFGGLWSRDAKWYFRSDEPCDPRQYLDAFRQCFIFRGRVSDVLLSCNETKHVLPADRAESWSVAGHCWISVVCKEWLRMPDIPVSNLPVVGEPFRFGEGLRLTLLYPLTWMAEDRTWIFRPVEDRSRINQPLRLTSIEYWWEDFPLEWLQDLIVAANSP
jgi:hypothetical protein